MKYYDGIYHYFYHCYLTSDSYLFIRKMKFNSFSPMNFDITKSNSFVYNNGKIASCYMTDHIFILCLSIYNSNKLSALKNSNLYVTVFDSNLNKKLSKELGYTMVPTSFRYLYFIKCIHLKEEIGVFIFYRAVNSKMVKYPVLLFKNYLNNQLNDYIPEVILDKKEFNTDCLLNVLIKINENKICFISTSENKEEMYIVLISIYDNSNIAIRYYNFNIFSTYTFKFYLNMRAYAFNNFITFAFSYCPTQSCSSSSDTHYPGLMIFNYPNGTDYNIDLFDTIFENNEIIESYIINLNNQVRIENNIFGLIYAGINIKQLINCNSIKFIYSKDDSIIISANYILSEGEYIIAKEIPIDKLECSITYAYLITEPSFEEYNSYPSEKVFQSSYNEQKFETEKENYESRLLYYNITISEDLSNICVDDNCLICKENNKNQCVICKYSYSTNNNEKYKICVAEGISITTPINNEKTESQQNIGENDTKEDIENNVETNEKEEIKETEENDNVILSEYINKKSDFDECTYSQILSNECPNGKLNMTQIMGMYEIFKDTFLTDDYNGQSKVISTENVVYQISTFEYQKNSDDPAVSSIDLGTCESRLKYHYNVSKNDSLIVYKIDYKNEDLSQTYVHYEIYDPYDHHQLNMSLCDDLKIIINTPVDLDDNSIKLYESLKEYGYNIFDSGDDFYTDICSTYTTVNGTDMLIEDRKSDIYYTTGNVTMCQTGCEFILYNTTTKKSKCNCEVQSVSSDGDLNNVQFSTKKLADEFLTTFTNSNFRVLKCYKLAFGPKKFFKNIGRILMSLFFIFYLVSLFTYIIFERKKINMFINLIIKDKDKETPKNEINDNKLKEKIKFGKKNKIKEKKAKSEIGERETKKIKKIKLKKSKKKITNFPPKRKYLNIIRKKSDFISSTSRNIDTKTISPLTNKSDNKKININIYPGKNANANLNKKFKKKKTEEKRLNTDNRIDINFVDYKNLNDEELNSLDYNIAVVVDKRAYFQYYWSLLKKDHLILFTVLPANDYNLYSLKVALFLLSVSLYFTINGFFFSDSTMHKINENNGKFDLIYQIPQILYSSIISSVINMLLKNLSLSEKNILLLKRERNIQKAKKESNKIKRCIIIKFIIFFIISNSLLLFFWYFISCFCAVYINTQKTLLKDTFISFGFSMLYPFGLNLFSGFFRIPALRDKAQKSKCMYKISGYLALL